MAYPRHGRSFDRRVERWWGQLWLHSQNVEWSFIGCLIFQSKLFFLSLFGGLENLILSFSLSIQNRVSIESLLITLLSYTKEMTSSSKTNLSFGLYCNHGYVASLLHQLLMFLLNSLITI